MQRLKGRRYILIFSIIIFILLVFILILHIHNELFSPHYKFMYNQDSVSIQLYCNKDSNDYFTFTTNNTNAFIINSIDDKTIPCYYKYEKVRQYNLNLNIKYKNEKPKIYIARIRKNKVISVIGYQPFYVKNKFHSYEPYKSKTIVQEFNYYCKNNTIIK